MNNNDLTTPGATWNRAKKVLSSIDSKPVSKANIQYAFTAVGLTGILMWLIGINDWIILIGCLLQAIYFFGAKVTKSVFRLLLTVLITILLCGLANNVLIEKTGLSDEFESYKKTIVLKIGRLLENPADDLQARMVGVIRRTSNLLIPDTSKSKSDDSASQEESSEKSGEKTGKKDSIKNHSTLSLNDSIKKNQREFNDLLELSKTVQAMEDRLIDVINNKPQKVKQQAVVYQAKESFAPRSVETKEVEVESAMINGKVFYRAEFTLKPHERTQRFVTLWEYQFQLLGSTVSSDFLFHHDNGVKTIYAGVNSTIPNSSGFSVAGIQSQNAEEIPFSIYWWLRDGNTVKPSKELFDKNKS